MKKISFNVDEITLSGNLFYPKQLKNKNSAILFLPGWDSDQRRYFKRAEVLSKIGFICMTFDYRASGASEGDRDALTIEDYLHDVITAYDYLKDLENVSRIGVIGASFGGYLSTLLSAKRDVSWLVLTAPSNYFNESFDTVKKDDNAEVIAWRKQKLNPSETYSLNALTDYTNELLLVELELDTDVPRQTVLNYVNAAGNASKLSHKVIQGAKHGMPEEKSKEEYLRILQEWFQHKASLV